MSLGGVKMTSKQKFVRVSSRLSEDMHARLIEMANARGVTQSALISWVIGEWMLNQNRMEPLLNKLGVELVEYAKSTERP